MIQRRSPRYTAGKPWIAPLRCSSLARNPHTGPCLAGGSLRISSHIEIGRACMIYLGRECSYTRAEEGEEEEEEEEEEYDIEEEKQEGAEEEEEEEAAEDKEEEA